MFKTLLLAVDVADHKGATRTSEAAVNLARTEGATLHVLNVVPDSGMAMVGAMLGPDHSGQMQGQARAELEAWAKVAEMGGPLMDRGKWIIMFPEGTRTERGSQGEIDPGDGQQDSAEGRGCGRAALAPLGYRCLARGRLPCLRAGGTPAPHQRQREAPHKPSIYSSQTQRSIESKLKIIRLIYP